jgi:DNA helicase HerA-like ATPase
MQTPRLYATFLLWLLSELFENLPEVGDPEIPKLVFFFDEAHLLFNDAPKALLEKVEQVVRLVRSKGVGVFFVTQNPLDVPDTVLGQLGNRVQHALRAFTPRDQKAVKAAAQTFRQNPKLDTATVIMELGVGEALISFLEAGGIPAMVDRAFVLPPASRLGAITPEERQAIITASPVKGNYEQTVDRASAFETLRDRNPTPATTPSGSWRRPGDVKTRTPTSGPWGNAPAPAPAPQRQERSTVEKIVLGDGRRQGLAEAMAKSAVRQIGSSLGRQILRGVLGSIMKG